MHVPRTRDEMDCSYRVEEGLAGEKGDGEGKVFHRGAGLTFEKERLGRDATRVCGGRHVLGLASSVVPGPIAAEKEALGVPVKEEESGMPRTLGRNVPVAVPEQEGEVGAGEGVAIEQHFGDLGLGHVTILKALFDAGNQDRIHRPPTAHPRASGSQRPPMNLDWTTRPPRDGKTVIT